MTNDWAALGDETVRVAVYGGAVWSVHNFALWPASFLRVASNPEQCVRRFGTMNTIALVNGYLYSVDGIVFKENGEFHDEY